METRPTSALNHGLDGSGPRDYLNPIKTFLFRVPYYDFFIYSLKKVGSMGSRQGLH